MRDDKHGVGMSRYNGLRLTLTASPTSPDVMVSVSAKAYAGGWDDWSRLIPVFRIERGKPLNDSLEALRLLRSAVDDCIRNLED